VPVAVKCCVAPTIKLAVDEGVTAIDANVITVKATGWLVIPARVAVILADPPFTPVAVPPDAIVIIPGRELDQVT